MPLPLNEHGLLLFRKISGGIGKQSELLKL